MMLQMHRLSRSIARNSFVALTFWICGACEAPKKQVFVDVDRAVEAFHDSEIPTDELLIPKRNGVGGESSKLNSKPQISLSGSEAEERLAVARADIERQKMEALELLSKQVFESFLRDVERFRLKSNSEIESGLRENLGASSVQISDLLKEFAEKRWPVANRLALFVDYPFPDVSAAMLEGDSKIVRDRNREVIALYKKLDDLNAKYQSEVQAVFNQLFASAAQSRLDLGLRVVEMLDEADKRARLQAQRAISGVVEDVFVLLATKDLVQIPALNESNVTVETGLRERLPAVGFKPESPAIISKRREAEADLKIWLGIHALQLVETRGKAPDKTENFIKWRIQPRPGR